MQQYCAVHPFSAADLYARDKDYAATNTWQASLLTSAHAHIDIPPPTHKH